jgi:hypothetical protein
VKAEVTTLTVTSGLPEVPRGTVLVLRDGKEFVVTGRTKTTLTLVPRRWWHKVPWWSILAMVAGAVVGQLLWHWWK